MKAILIFNLNTEDGRRKHTEALLGHKYKNVLEDLDTHMRDKLKNGILGKKEHHAIDEIRTLLWDTLHEEGITDLY